MENFKAQLLLENLLERVETLEDGNRKLTGKLTDAEMQALQHAIEVLSGTSTPQDPVAEVRSGQSVNKPTITPIQEYQPELQQQVTEVQEDPVSEHTYAPIVVNTSTLDLPVTSEDIRLCLDFGTAMSKATLVEDDEYLDAEKVQVLKLGLYGDHEDEYMLVSSVYIDNSGRLWFGKAANDLSISETDDGSRQRIDNIKRWLSEGGLDTPVSRQHNPTDIEIKYSDMILAYLMFLTWSVNMALENIEQPEGGYPKNINRRFAMPCLTGVDEKEAVHRLSQYLGEAQILADTFFSTLQSGIPLEQFVHAVRDVRQQKLDYQFVDRNISEPLGVAGSLISWRDPVDKLFMVIDVGAGTSDLSMYRFHFDPANEGNVAVEIKDSSRGITEAGNYLDQLLKAYILKMVGIDSSHPMFINAQWDLEKNIRDYKETLFNEGSVYLSLRTGDDVTIELDDFQELEAVQKFSQALSDTMLEILISVDSSWIEWATAGPYRNLTVVLTGGGASLPMVQELAKGSIPIKGKTIELEQARNFPAWLEEDYPDLDDDYPRVAVSLGGARRWLISEQGMAKTTAGDGYGKRIHEDPSLLW